MPGLLQLQARARSFSLATLLVYLGVLLLTFCHSCGPCGAEPGRAASAQRAPGACLERSLPAAGSAGHSCPVCAWQRDTLASPGTPESGAVTAPRCAAPAPRACPAPRLGAPLASAPRGPPPCDAG